MSQFLDSTEDLSSSSNISTLYSNDTDRNGVFTTLAAASFALMLIGIPGNLLVIVSISFSKYLRTTPNFLVLNLSCCDFLFLSFVVPSHAYTYLHGTWDYKSYGAFCWTVALFSNTLISSSVLGTGAIAINRYVAIVLSHKYRNITKTRALIVTFIAVYAIPLLLMSPILTGTYGSFGFDRRERQCGRVGGEVLLTVFIFVILILPLILMTFCYIHILIHVVSSRQRVGNNDTSNNTGTTGYNVRAEHRLSRMLTLVYVVYVVTTLPSLLVNIVRSAGVHMPWWSDMVDFFVLWTSSAINPVVYGLVNKKYRQAYKMVLRKCLFCRRSVDPGSVMETS